MGWVGGEGFSSSSWLGLSAATTPHPLLHPPLRLLQAQLVNVLVVHPSIFEHNGLETRARDVPLGLAHLLASTDVHVYVDPRCEILRLLAR